MGALKILALGVATGYISSFFFAGTVYCGNALATPKKLVARGGNEEALAKLEGKSGPPAKLPGNEETLAILEGKRGNQEALAALEGRPGSPGNEEALPQGEIEKGFAGLRWKVHRKKGPIVDIPGDRPKKWIPLDKSMEKAYQEDPDFIVKHIDEDLSLDRPGRNDRGVPYLKHFAELVKQQAPDMEKYFITPEHVTIDDVKTFIKEKRFNRNKCLHVDDDRLHSDHIKWSFSGDIYLQHYLTGKLAATSLSHDAKDVYFIDKDPPENSEEFIEEFDPLDSELDEGGYYDWVRYQRVPLFQNPKMIRFWWVTLGKEPILAWADKDHWENEEVLKKTSVDRLHRSEMRKFFLTRAHLSNTDGAQLDLAPLDRSGG